MLGLMAGSIAASLSEAGGNDLLLATSLAAITLSTIITGAFLFSLGLFGIGGLVRFIPFPVIGGFRAGIGWLLIISSFAVMTGKFLALTNLPFLMRPDIWLRWLPGLGFALIVTVLFRASGRFFVLPFMLALAVAAFYGVLMSTGMELDMARSQGWLLGPFPEAGVWAPVQLGDFTKLDWDLLISQFPKLGSMMLISLLALLLLASNIEIGVKQEMNLDRELKSAGLANMLTGLGGGQ